jgi:hypothetical protein
MDKHYDIFICHASEDKDSIARPLAEELQKRRLSVWYDETAITIGDSILAKIDEGLSNSRAGVIILSPHFFPKSKKWTKRELGALFAKGTPIIPVWHNLPSAEIAKYSPLLADIKAISSLEGIAVIADKIAAKIKGSSPNVISGREAARAEVLQQVRQLSDWNDNAKAAFNRWELQAHFSHSGMKLAPSAQQTLLDRYCPFDQKHRERTDNGFQYNSDLQPICTNTRTLCNFKISVDWLYLCVSSLGVNNHHGLEISNELLIHSLWYFYIARNAALTINHKEIQFSFNMLEEPGPIWIYLNTSDPISKLGQDFHVIYTDKNDIQYSFAMNYGSKEELTEISDSIYQLLQGLLDNFHYRDRVNGLRIPIVDRNSLSKKVQQLSSRIIHTGA